MVDIKKNVKKVLFAPKPESEKEKPSLEARIVELEGDLIAPKPESEKEKPSLEARIVELEGDLKRIVEVLAKLSGEPFRSILKNIVEKRQGA